MHTCHTIRLPLVSYSSHNTLLYLARLWLGMLTLDPTMAFDVYTIAIRPQGVAAEQARSRTVT